MPEKKDIFEGLNQERSETLRIVCNLLKYAQTFYSEAAHASSEGRNALPTMAALATNYRRIFRELRHWLYQDRSAESVTNAKIEAVRAYLAERGSRLGVVVKLQAVDRRWVSVGAETILADMNRAYDEYYKVYLKSNNP